MEKRKKHKKNQAKTNKYITKLNRYNITIDKQNEKKIQMQI